MGAKAKGDKKGQVSRDDDYDPGGVAQAMEMPGVYADEQDDDGPQSAAAADDETSDEYTDWGGWTNFHLHQSAAAAADEPSGESSRYPPWWSRQETDDDRYAHQRDPSQGPWQHADAGP